MVSKTDDIPASVPHCNPVDLADEPLNGAQESSKTRPKKSCGCGETQQAALDATLFIFTLLYVIYTHRFQNHNSKTRHTLTRRTHFIHRVCRSLAFAFSEVSGIQQCAFARN